MINKLLLIDDDEITLMICELVIKKENFAKEVVKLKNGLEGINYFRGLLDCNGETNGEAPPELVLLDLNMPVMNGWDFLEEFSESLEGKFPDTKVCVLTSSVDPFDFSHSRIYNSVIGFISKPLTPDALAELKANERLDTNFNNL
jgi:CheY-like chemotaxis protein